MTEIDTFFELGIRIDADRHMFEQIILQIGVHALSIGVKFEKTPNDPAKIGLQNGQNLSKMGGGSFIPPPHRRGKKKTSTNHAVSFNSGQAVLDT
jgi:hypothetical protein